MKWGTCVRLGGRVPKMRELKSSHFQENGSMVCSVSLSCCPASRLCDGVCSNGAFFPADQTYIWHISQLMRHADYFDYMWQIGVCTYKKQWLINTLLEINFGREGMQITWMNGWIVVDAAVFLEVFILIFDPADIAVSDMTDLVPLGGITWWR